MKLKNFKRIIALTLIMGLMLGNLICQVYAIEARGPQGLAQNNLEEGEELLSQGTSPFSLDVRLVPEYEQINQAILKNDLLPVDSIFYQTNSPFIMNMNQFQIRVDSTTIYDLHDGSIQKNLADYKAQDFGGLILLHISIVNTSNSPLQFPNNALMLSPGQDSMWIQSTPSLYPLGMGGLDQVLEANSSIILPEQSLEGYLVYGINSLDFQIIQWKGYFEMVLSEPIIPVNIRTNDQDIIQEIPHQRVSEKNTQVLVLPSNSSVEEDLNLKNNYMVNRLTNEWWGKNKLIASEKLGLERNQDPLNVVLSQVELVDFSERDEYKKYFQEFAEGQLVLTSLITIENKSPSMMVLKDQWINGRINIGNSQIAEEKFLAMNQNNIFLLPGDKKIYTSVFILDREMYQHHWQELPMMLMFSIQSQQLDLNFSTFMKQTFKKREPAGPLLENNLGLFDMFFQKASDKFDFSWKPSQRLYMAEDFELYENKGTQEDN